MEIIPTQKLKFKSRWEIVERLPNFVVYKKIIEMYSNGRFIAQVTKTIKDPQRVPENQ